LFLVPSNPFGQGFDGNAQMANLRDQARHGPGVVAVGPLLLDHHPQGRIPVERGATVSRHVIPFFWRFSVT
jgi:hypothetical protein